MKTNKIAPSDTDKFTFACFFSHFRHMGYYLLGHADTGRRQSLPAAKAACTALEAECLGVTCLTPLEPSELDDSEAVPGLLPQDRFGRNSCTARIGKEGLQDSPEGREVSYIKTCGTHHDLSDLENEGGTYRSMKDSFLFGYAANDDVVRGEQDSRKRCDELGNLCSGFTCEKSIPLTKTTTKQAYAEAQRNQSCTVRAGAELISSPSGELTFVKIPASAQLSGAVSRVTSKMDASGVFQFYTGSQSIVRKEPDGVTLPKSGRISASTLNPATQRLDLEALSKKT